jgi:vacuolar-type H+-ATPase subunit F/Vma7
MVCLVINGKKLPAKDELVKRLNNLEFSDDRKIASIMLNFNTEKTNVILGRECALLSGDPYIEDYIGDVKYRIQPLSFYQVNPVQTKVLYGLALEYAGVSQVVVTDLSQDRLDYAAAKSSVENAAKHGVELIYLNTSGIEDVAGKLREISKGGFDDVFVMVPVPALFTLAEEICCEDGCVNFFAGPAVHNLQGSLNLYRVHYDGIHVVGTAGSIPEDTVDTIHIIEKKQINAGALVSHILGLDAYPDAILAMEKPNGCKKVCYTGIDIPLVALEDFAELGKTDPLFAELDRIVKANDGLWCTEAEEYLLANGPKI